MYKLFLDLTTFLVACKQVGAILNVQPVQKAAQHTIPYVEASLMLTAAAPTRSPGAPRILAARVVNEETQMWPDDRAAHTALTDRAALADTLLRAACTAAGVPVAPHDGILAEPGLLTNLWQISTAQELWHIERPDMRDSAAWTLQPRPATGTAPHQAGDGDPAPWCLGCGTLLPVGSTDYCAACLRLIEQDGDEKVAADERAADASFAAGERAAAEELL